MKIFLIKKEKLFNNVKKKNWVGFNIFIINSLLILFIYNFSKNMKNYKILLFNVNIQKYLKNLLKQVLNLLIIILY